MKKKILCALLVLCLLTCLLPLTAMAADPDITVKFATTTAESRFSLTLAPGDVKYVVTNADKQFAPWNEANTPADKFVKLEYPTDGKATLQVTLNNIDAENTDTSSAAYTSHALNFTAGEYAVVLNLVGTNKITADKSACVFYEATKGLTITGSGSLIMHNTGAVDGSIWARGGDLLIKNTTLDITVDKTDDNSKYNAILSASGNVTFEGAKITYSTGGGAFVFMGTLTQRVGRYTLDKSTDRFITIKDCEITGNANLSSFSSANPCTVINSTLSLTKKSTGSASDDNKAIFYPAPKLEGECTAIAGLAKNADNLEKLKLYNEKKLTSYTYFKVVPGILELPTEPTEPETQAPTTETPTTEATVAPTTEATVPDETKNEATQPTTDDKNEATQPTTADKNNNENDKTDDDATEEKSGSPLKVILIVLIVLIVAGGAAVGVIFYLRSKNAVAEDEEDEEEEEETEEAEETEADEE